MAATAPEGITAPGEVELWKEAGPGHWVRVASELPGELETKRISIGEALKKYGQRLVIIGAPGAGKTTLLSYLALKFARGQAKESMELDERRLPILIPLRNLSREKLALTPENLPTLAINSPLAKECPPGFFHERLTKGNCIVLLDGMDEVTNEAERLKMVEQIEALGNQYRHNRFVVTSRPAGYQAFSLRGFTELTVQDFDDEDIRNFARYWSQAVEIATRGGNGATALAEARRRGEENAKALIAAIEANERVKRLGVNPLLLSIIALVHRYRATLPYRRVELYDECTDVLLGYWDIAKGIAGQLDPARKRRVLEPLAFWLHSQGLREAGRADVEREIAKALPAIQEEPGKAAEFLENIRERSGLLLERGLDIYSFSHLTFQEYLTASYLGRREDGLTILSQHIHDPWWQEVVLLYAGLKDATPLIRTILGKKEDLFKYNLLLAGRCLVDVVEVADDLRQQVIADLLNEFWWGNFIPLQERARELVIEIARSPVAGRSGREIVGAFLNKLGDESAEVRGSAAGALGGLGQASPEAVGLLVKALGDESAEVRRSAAWALGRLGQASPEAVGGLVKALGDKSAEVRGSAAGAFGGLGQASPEVVGSLAKALGDESATVRESAAGALGGLGQASLEVVGSLAKALGDESATVRESAAEALGRLEQASLEVVDGLVKALGDESAEVRRSAVWALQALGQASPEVVDGLVKALGDDEHEVYSSAAEVLNALKQATPEVVGMLVKALGDESPEIRGRAADALGHLGQDVPEAIRLLVKALEDQSPEVQWRAAWALGALKQSEPEVIVTLLKFLPHERAEVQWNAALTLVELKQVSPEVVGGLVKSLGDESAEVRRSAARALRALGQASLEVAGGLVKSLGDESAEARGSAVWALRVLGKASPKVMGLLLKSLGDESAEVRRSAAWALGELGQASPEVVGLLVKSLGDESAEVRGSAVWALQELVRASGPEDASWFIESLKPALRSDVELEPRYYPVRWKRVKDNAFELLEQLSQRSGQPIYVDEVGV